MLYEVITVFAVFFLVLVVGVKNSFCQNETGVDIVDPEGFRKELGAFCLTVYTTGHAVHHSGMEVYNISGR